MVLFMIEEKNVWSTVTWPLIPVLDVEEVKDLKESVLKLMMETYPQLCNTADKPTFATFFDPEVQKGPLPEIQRQRDSQWTERHCSCNA